MNRPSALIAVAALFLLGVLSGLFAAHLYHAHRLEGRRFGPPLEHGSFLDHLDERLGLTPEQREQLEEIVRESHREAGALRTELRPRARAQMERTRERINAILTPEQREEFEKLHQRHRRRSERFFLDPPPPGAHGPKPRHRH